MSDIVERLQSGDETCGVNKCRVMEAKSGCLCAEAAAEITRLRAALATQQPPPGWKLAPTEQITRRMLNAGAEQYINWKEACEGECLSDKELQDIFHAMLAAAPQPGETQ